MLCSQKLGMVVQCLDLSSQHADHQKQRSHVMYDQNRVDHRVPHQYCVRQAQQYQEVNLPVSLHPPVTDNFLHDVRI